MRSKQQATNDQSLSDLIKEVWHRLCETGTRNRLIQMNSSGDRHN